MEYIVFSIVFIIFIVATILFLRVLSQIFFGYGVPYVPTSDFKIDILVKNLKLNKNDNFLDLGSGDGRVLEAVRKKFSGVKLYGIENSYYPYKLSIKRKKEKSLDYEVYRKDFFKEDFNKYRVIYSYTIPYLMDKIWDKIQKECEKGTLFYSNSFEIKGVKAIDKFETSKGRYIFVYKV